MTGLQHHRLIKLTAKINLLYLVYVLISLNFGIFPFKLVWQKLAFFIFMVTMSVHARMGLWAVVTDYIPETFQNLVLRLIELYLFIILIWVIILLCL